MRGERERRVRDAIGRVRAPEEAEATERAWRLVQAARAEQPALQPTRRLRRRALQLGLVAAVAVLVAGPAGASVRDWVADTVSPGVESARPTLTTLPAPGSLLVQSAQGPWVVQPDGSKRLLGKYAGATWSPHGLYVAATSRHELAVIEPNGEVRWTLDRAGPVRLPSWNGPDGYRLAYLDGDSLRVVNGDGSGDRMLARSAAPVAAAWMSGPRHVLAFARPSGAIVAVGADDGRQVFATGPGALPTSLRWSGDGRALLVSRPGGVELLDSQGAVRWRWSAPGKARVLSTSLAPAGDRVALILRHAGGSRLVLAGPGAPTRTLFSGPGRFSGVQWSPGGERLLLAWQSADQWLFLKPDRPAEIDAVANVSQQFDPGASASAAPFPRVSGWCCSDRRGTSAMERLGLTYGPYLGIRCRNRDARCNAVGIDLVLRKGAKAVSATIGGHRISLSTPGLHDGVRGKDWVGLFRQAGLGRKGSPIYISSAAGSRLAWAGDPSVYVPVRVSVTFTDHHRVSATIPGVRLSPGWG